MQLGGVTGGIYKVCDWLMKLAIVNLLWILFALLGLGIFGLFPATIAMLTVLNYWTKQEECKVVRTFADAYKESFIKANVFMLLIVTVGAVLITNYMIIQSMNGILHVFLKYGLIFMFVIYSLVVLYIMPILSYRSQGIWNTVKMAFITGALHPARTGILLGGFVLLYLIIRSFPGMIPFYSVSLIGLWTTVILSPILKSEVVERLQEKQIKCEKMVRT
ncbi:YesL family protein [Alkalihalobacillus sp. BA299]|uniref:YesL family protein n=1 Tax=Alkalihalobacillus sp. BA299 TaxID=2815938 RepID=UPI001AD9C5EE|nr:YesL family protein [Alkalihalobacillus sp. BA299]